MNVENELKSLRYLVNNLILSVYDMRLKINDLLPPKRRTLIPEVNVNGNAVKFDLFLLSKKQYDSLVDKYGVDVVTKACVKLDEFIKLNDYIPFKIPHLSLSRKFIKEVIAEDNKEIKEAKENDK